ncbi:MAG: DEAD/DEAH box helicase [Saprospiraceae bacterium]|nr:DEAD/DEAH box helicase [Saprospiraceae bacterium]MBK7788821.1 DEAD/DEAH box helicase [Saprospiraceae bacterium]MBK8850217.1 DEAD/DEAH box helicase [Saprospiraceae bacterium]
MNSFETSGLKPEILAALKDLGFVTPTPIQQQTLQLLIHSRKDLIALAQTGTGKTAAFSLPLLQNLTGNETDVRVLILAPTRELCLQIANDIKSYTKYLPGIRSVAVYGGANITTQISALREGAQIVVGTPGRTLDLLERKKLKVDKIQTLVLDEADEMLSMGFKDELDAILAGTPENKQVLLFSATMPDEIRHIASKYMHSPQEVSGGRANKSNEMITHYYYVVSAKDRYNALKRIADVNPDIYAIIFCRTKAETQEVADKLGHDGYNADALHGDLSQAQRDYVMNRFRKRQLQMLVATDVAARGLDVTELTHVINYNLPDDPEVYIHRSGRTGRAGKTGESVSIIHTKEFHKIRQLEKKIGKSIDLATVPTGKEICEVQLLNLIDKVKEVEINDDRIQPFLPAIMESIANIDHIQLIKKFVLVEFNRFLDYYKDAVDINVSDKQSKKSKEAGGGASYVKFFMNHGSQSKITPGILINLINEHMPNSTVGIGRIDIRKNMSLFDVEASHQEDLIEAFKRTAYKGLIVRPDQGQNDQPERRFRKDEGSSRSSGSAYGSKKPTEKKKYEGKPTERRKFDAKPAPKGKRKSWT